VPSACLASGDGGNCLNAADQHLLIYVSVLSGCFRHVAAVKNRRSTTSLRAAAAAFALVTVLVGLPPSALRADEIDDLRQAVERGEIRSLADILSVVRGKLPGDVAGVEVERENGRWLYEFRVIDDKGRLFEIYVDAKTATIERTKEK
jgi:uncharacterized membrane protein YkoI